MIFKSTSPLSPNVSVFIKSISVVTNSLQQIVINNSENKHSMATLTFSGLPSGTLSTYLNKAIKIEVKYPNLKTETFTGTISFIQPTSNTNDGLVNDSQLQIVNMVCFGASYRMNSRYSKIWSNVSIADITKSFADKYNFSLSVPNNPYRFPSLVQKQETDWSFLLKAISYLGYSGTVEGTHIHIWDPSNSASHKTSLSTITTLKNKKGSIDESPGQILTFNVTIGSSSFLGRTQGTASINVLDSNNNVYKITQKESESSVMGEDLSNLYTTDLPVKATSFAMANELLKGHLRKGFPVSASASLTADTTIKVGGIVYLDKYGEDFDGYWYVNQVTHRIFHSQMFTDIEISKDGLNKDTSVYNGYSSYVDPPDSALIKNDWVSSKDMVDVYD